MQLHKEECPFPIKPRKANHGRVPAIAVFSNKRSIENKMISSLSLLYVNFLLMMKFIWHSFSLTLNGPTTLIVLPTNTSWCHAYIRSVYNENSYSSCHEMNTKSMRSVSKTKHCLFSTSMQKANHGRLSAIETHTIQKLIGKLSTHKTILTNPSSNKLTSQRQFIFPLDRFPA